MINCFVKPSHENSLYVLYSLLICAILSLTAPVFSQEATVSEKEESKSVKQRVFVLSDIANEPDDEQSLVRFLVYANEYDIEGIVATTSHHLKTKPREDLIHRSVAAYGKVRTNLLLHASDFPTAQSIDDVVASGQVNYGMAGVAKGKSSIGAQLLLNAVRKNDSRPLWVSVWGGANTLAQALVDARDKYPDELNKIVNTLRVYTISDQDDAGAWLRREFPNLFYIVSPSTSWKEYYRATWTGISGDRHYKNGPMHKFELVDNPWLTENIIKNHGPLGQLYPRTAYIMEGDTPSYIGLVQNGLCWHVRPDYGGWGGRYKHCQFPGETRPCWTDNNANKDTVTVENGKTYTSNQATIWRWRQAYQHDFAARMDWCVQPYKNANHNPIVVVNSIGGKGQINLPVKAGQQITLSAAGSSDPDGDKLTYRWFHYPGAGKSRMNLPVKITNADSETATCIAPGFKDKTLPQHIILEIKDNGKPALFSYRRIVLKASRFRMDLSTHSDK